MGHLKVPDPCKKQGHLQLNHVAQSHLHLDLACFQRLGSHHLSGWTCSSVLPPSFKKNSFLLSSWNLPSFGLKQLPLVLLQLALRESLALYFLWALFTYWKGTMRSSQNLCFPGWTPPDLLACLHKRKVPSIIFLAFVWTHSNRSMLFLCWWLHSWLQYSRWSLTKAK